MAILHISYGCMVYHVCGGSNSSYGGRGVTERQFVLYRVPRWENCCLHPLRRDNCIHTTNTQTTSPASWYLHQALPRLLRALFRLLDELTDRPKLLTLRIAHNLKDPTLTTSHNRARMPQPVQRYPDLLRVNTAHSIGDDVHAMPRLQQI